jgi:uncharacterized membrane protein
MVQGYEIGGQQVQRDIKEYSDDRRHDNATNVGPTERQLSLVGGGLLLLTGLLRRDLKGLLLAGLGSGLLYRGATGNCDVYRALGINSRRETPWTGDGADTGIEVVESFLIDRPIEELYAFWHDFENLPKVMTHLKSVKRLDNRRSHWTAEAPTIAGGSVEWDAIIVEDNLNSLIRWRSEPGSQIDNRGYLEFKKAPGDRGTAVRVSLEYLPPAGTLGRWLAKLFGNDPESLIREDLRNFKRFMEIGEILTTKGQPRGACFAGVGHLMQ